MLFLIILVLLSITQCRSQIYSNDLNFRVEPGGRTCFYQAGNIGDMMEVYYQVIDGQHGDLDISLDVTDPAGEKIISDYKKSQNVMIKEIVLNGDYEFCLDNSFSSYNSKLVFIYVLVEAPDTTQEAVVSVVDEDGNEVKQIEVLHWEGIDENGTSYDIPVEVMADSLTRTLKQVVKARHMLDLYGATKSRDAYLAFEEIFVVDLWSGFQITVMCIVGLLQVFMIKKLFRSRPTY